MSQEIRGQFVPPKVFEHKSRLSNLTNLKCCEIADGMLSLLEEVYDQIFS